MIQGALRYSLGAREMKTTIYFIEPVSYFLSNAEKCCSDSIFNLRCKKISIKCRKCRITFGNSFPISLNHYNSYLIL